IILTLDRDNFDIEKKTKIKRKFKDIKLLKKSKNSGIEAIAIDKNNNIYISNQSKIRYKKSLKENSSVVFKINSIKKKKAKIVEVFNHRYIDIAGITFYNDYLYMVSDKKNLLIKYDINKNKTIKKIKLPKYAQEGLCFDNKNNIYIADDNGNIFKYKDMF
ncbi:MAG: SdiA-regulated domain-containing protein, partial [Campylobacterota bacterium]|nr:SdiA-regulated domain-containing protein [Campylobacterota bacterium]